MIMRLTGLVTPIFLAVMLAVATIPAQGQTAAEPATSATAAPISASAASIQRGYILSQTCAFCHGLENYIIPYPTRHVPLIGGQHAEYVISALNEYAEKHRSFPTMKAQAASLTQKQIHDIAAFISSIGTKKVTNGNAKAPAFAATCAACHGARGVSTNPQYPSLAGQHEDYLLLSLKEYKSGKRKNATMNAMAAPLTLEQMKKLAYYFSQQPSALELMPLPGPQ